MKIVGLGLKKVMANLKKQPKAMMKEMPKKAVVVIRKKKMK